jgi:hypothetical protein
MQASHKLDIVVFYRDADPVVADADAVEAAGSAHLHQIRYLAQRLGDLDLFYRFPYTTPQRFATNFLQVTDEASPE